MIGSGAWLALRKLQPDFGADVDARQIVHAVRPHGETERFHHGVDALRRDTLQQHELAFAEVAVEHHAIADEAKSIADDHADLAQHLGEREAGLQGRVGSLTAAHDFQQSHDIRRTEEVQAEHAIGPGSRLGKLCHRQARGIRGEDGRVRHDTIEPRKDRALEGHVLEYGLDHDGGIARRIELEGATDAAHASLDFRHVDAAAPRGALVVFANRLQSPV
jgi:hypothetical protein